MASQPVRKLTIRLPRGLDVNIVFFDPNDPNGVPQGDDDVPIKITLKAPNKAELDTEDQDNGRGRDAIC